MASSSTPPSNQGLFIKKIYKADDQILRTQRATDSALLLLSVLILIVIKQVEEQCSPTEFPLAQ